MPFGRDLAPAMLHRHTSHGEAVARITWCVDQRAIAVITGEVGAGKTVAVRAAAANLDPSRHVIIYLSNPTIGVRGMLTHIVAALGHTPAFHRAALTPQAAEALAAEHQRKRWLSSLRGGFPGLIDFGCSGCLLRDRADAWARGSRAGSTHVGQLGVAAPIPHGWLGGSAA
jgi:hypothetical protein